MTQPTVSSFDTLQDAQHAVERLQQRGIPADDISLISNNTQGGTDTRAAGSVSPQAPATMKDDGGGAATGAAVGGVTGGLAGLAVGLMGLAIPGVGPVIAAGAGLSALAGAGAGVLAGGLIGALTDVGVPEDEAHSYAESVRRGGTLLIVRTRDTNLSDINDVLRECGAVDLDARTQDWRASGWSRHDASAAPYAWDEIERERARHRGATAGGLGGGTVSAISGSTMAATSMSGADLGGADTRVRSTESTMSAHAETSDPSATSAASASSMTSTASDRHGVGAGGNESARGFGDWGAHEDAFRRHHAQNLAGTGEYDAYAAAYQFGGDQNRHAMYRDKSWEEIELQVRRDWESRRDGGPWNNFKAAVRYGWEATRNAVERVIPGDSDHDGR